MMQASYDQDLIFGGNQQEVINNIGVCYLTALFMSISIGTLNVGYMIGVWNTVYEAYSLLYKWGDDADDKQSAVQTITLFGCAVGALGVGPLTRFGKLNTIIGANLILILGSGLSLIEGYGWLLVGRFIYGVSIGVFSVFCPKYIGETVPKEVSGPFGTLTQLCIAFGVQVPFTIGLFFKDFSDYNDKQLNFVVNLMFCIPMALAVVQMVLLIFVFRYDTPVVLHKSGQYQRLREFFEHIYSPALIQSRIDQVAMVTQSSDSIDVSYKDCLMSPYYRRATIVGCVLCVFQITTGINVILSYFSHSLYADLTVSKTTITALAGFGLLIFTFLAALLLMRFGRRQLMIWGNALMAVTMCLIGLFLYLHHTTLVVIFIVLEIIWFSISSGPIVWLYCAEILQDKAMTLAISLIWLSNIIISYATPLAIKALEPNHIGIIFFVVGGLTAFATVFIVFRMKETRGLHQHERYSIFITDRSERMKLIDDFNQGLKSKMQKQQEAIIN